MAELRPTSDMKDSGIEWIGHVPQDWKTKKARWLFRERTEKGNPVCVQLLTPSQKHGVLPQNLYQEISGTKPVQVGEEKDLSEFKTVRSGDFCISLSAYMGGFEYSEYEGVISPAYHSFFKCSGEINNAYYRHLFKSSGFIDAVNIITPQSVRVGRNTSFESFKEVVLPIPPLPEQQAIADYLDDRCSQIDEIIAEATASIEEYKELKQAVIFEAVTKGLDKNASLKDSGIEWLPQIPENWQVKRIAAIYEESKETGRNDLPILLVSINTGISDREIDDAERDRKVIRSEDKTIYKVIHRNYLAYNMMRAWQGGFGAATVDGLVSPAYVVAKPKIAMNSSYIEHVLRTPNAIEHIRGLSYGVADFRLRLYWPYFKNIRIPVPSIQEQNCIVGYINEQSKKMDVLISEKQSLIDDLQAYKKSLIYEVVTGKRRVV